LDEQACRRSQVRVCLWVKCDPSSVATPILGEPGARFVAEGMASVVVVLAIAFVAKHSPAPR
jgi:hypothetical protein